MVDRGAIEKNLIIFGGIFFCVSCATSNKSTNKLILLKHNAMIKEAESANYYPCAFISAANYCGGAWSLISTQSGSVVAEINPDKSPISVKAYYFSSGFPLVKFFFVFHVRGKGENYCKVDCVSCASSENAVVVDSKSRTNFAMSKDKKYLRDRSFFSYDQYRTLQSESFYLRDSAGIPEKVKKVLRRFVYNEEFQCGSYVDMRDRLAQ